MQVGYIDAVGVTRTSVKSGSEAERNETKRRRARSDRHCAEWMRDVTKEIDEEKKMGVAYRTGWRGWQHTN